MELCLISKETMEHEIKLPCNHSFEYIYLYHEIIEQKKTSTKGFNCPYCRAFYEHSIPYYELEGIEKKTKINYHLLKRYFVDVFIVFFARTFVYAWLLLYFTF